MRTQARWTERTPEQDGVRLPAVDMCFSPQGDQIITCVGQRVMVYSASTGSLIHSLKGHKDTVYCCTYAADGKRFATGGADRTVIIWTSRGDGILKYQHQESIQAVSYNPVSGQLASVTAIDFGIWSVDQKNVAKHKLPARGCSCAWTTDGLYLAIGMFNGSITIRNAAHCSEEKIVIKRDAPIWTMAFNPVRQTGDDIEGNEMLAVGSWDKKLSFYTIPEGKQVYGGDKELTCDPCCVSYFANGEYLVLAGSDRKAGLYSKDGTYLVTVAETQDWIWSVKQRPKQYFIGTCSNDGAIAGIELNITTVHSIYQDHYVFRENLTDVVIQHLSTDRKLRINCKDYVKKVAMYRERAAVQLTDKVIIYDITSDESGEMKYKEKDRIRKKLDCSLLCVTASHLILCQDKRLTLYDFKGNKRREWSMDSVIRYIKVVGGLADREALLVGLKNGLVAKIFVDNSFPTTLVKMNVPVRCLDLSSSRNKLAVVDEQNNLQVFSLGPNSTSELLFQESNATAVAWNSDYEEMLCYSGGGTLSIKTGNLPPYQQKLQGFVVGFKGNKLFTLHSATMYTIDVPHSHALYRFVERREFENAYRIACLGVTNGDWKMLGMHAMSQLNLDIARKAFIRTKETKLVELLNRIELERRASNLGTGDESLVLGDILAFQGKYSQAAACFIQCNQEQKAVEMYSDLKMWDEALKVSEKGEHSATLIKKQAEWAETLGDYKEAAKLALAAGDINRAIKLLGEQGEVDKLMDVCRTLTKADGAAVAECARYFRKHGASRYALEAYERTGDIKGLLALHVEQGTWQEAFRLLERYPQYNADVYVPWATWLATHDRFDEAQEAFKMAGRPSDALRILEQLAGNSITTKKFNNAAYYLMKLAGECGGDQPMFGEADGSKSKKDFGHRISRFNDFVRRADCYYAFHLVHTYMSQPFTTCEHQAIFNACKFLSSVLSATPQPIPGISDDVPYNIYKVDVLLALGRLCSAMELNRVARTVYEKLQQFVLSPTIQEQVDIATLAIRGRPFQDKEEFLSTCARCQQTVAGFTAPGDRCPNCFHPFVRSFVSFEALPLVEFILADDLTDGKAEQIVLAGVGKQPKGLDWKDDNGNGADVITFSDDIVDVALNSQANGGVDSRDPFARQLVQIELSGRTKGQYVPIKCDANMLKKFRADEIYIVRRSKHAPGLPIANKYYRLMLPNVGITICENCQHFFHDEEYEFELMRGNGCPVCRSKPGGLAKPDIHY